MMAFADIAVAVLAAGQGRRFGSDKLMADLEGVPMGLHIAQALAPMQFGWHFAVCRSGSTIGQRFAATGFSVIANDQPEAGQSHSLHLAVLAAEPTTATALLVMLADMPFVSADHVAALVAAYDGHIIASTDGSAMMPPAIFPRETWASLMGTTGDGGARGLLRDARSIAVPAGELRDIDVAGDLHETPRQ